MDNTFAACAKSLAAVAKKPEAFFRADPKLAKKLLKATKVLYDNAQSVSSSASPSPGPLGLPTLLLDGFDSDQIWAELELYNEPALTYFDRYAVSLTEIVSDEDTDSSNESQVDQEAQVEESSEEEDEDEDEAVDSSAQEEGSEMEIGDGQTETGDNAIEEEQDEDADEKEEILLEELDRFHEMMEAYDEKQAAGLLDDDEFIDLNDGMEDDDDVDAAMITWDEFDRADAAEEEEEHEDPNEQDVAEESENEDSSENEEAEATQHGTGAVDEANLTNHQKRQRAMQIKIEELEEKMLKPRTWDLIGEVTATKRPENSLLEKNLDVNYLGVGQIGEIDEEEMDLSIEGMIKQRIKDEAFDDVERKEEIVEKEFRPRAQVDDTKSQYGLAEIYEREYQEMQRTDNKTEADDKRLAAHKEISVLFSSLCHKLDSLSNFHMTPKPPREEMTVASQPALNMEETLPMAVSDAHTKAPEELFASSSRGAPMANDEMTKEEKVAHRSRKKKRHKKKRKAAAAVAASKPQSSNAALHQANELIRTSRNIESVDTSRVEGTNFTNSTAFFSEISNPAKPKAKKRKTNKNQFKL